MANRNVTLKRNNAGTSEELYPTTDWSQVNNKPATFTPTAHTHTKSDITDFAHTHSEYAPLASPALTGTPTAPTAANSTNTTQLATTAFVTNKLAGIGGGGLNFEGTISLSTSKTADDLYSAGLTAEGDYLIVSATGNIVSGGTLLSLAVQSPGDEGDDVLPVTLETGDWIVFVSNVSQVLTVAIINNTDTRFAPTTHTHTIANVTGLQTAIDGKVSKTGDTMTGDLTIDKTAPKIFMSDDTLTLGLSSEVGGQLINYGTNYDQLGSRNAAYPGSFFRIDVRDAQASEMFNVKYIPPNSTEQTVFKVSRTGEVVATGSVNTPQLNLSGQPLQVSGSNLLYDGDAVWHEGNFNPSSYLTTSGKAADANLLDGLDSSAYLRDDGWNTYPGQDANTQDNMRADFTYSNNAPQTGSLISFGAGGYQMQLNSSYAGGGNEFYYRTRQGDTASWNAWKRIWHDGHFNPNNFITTTNNSSLNSDSRNTRGVTRLYRRDDNSDFSVQNYWTGSYWRMEGYNGDNYHAGVSVAIADYSNNSNNLDGLDSVYYLKYRGISSSGDFQTFQSSAEQVRFDQVNNTNNLSNKPPGYTYGGVASFRGSNFGMQLWGSHIGDFYFKTQWDNDQYSGWREVIHSANIGSQSVSYASGAGNLNGFNWDTYGKNIRGTEIYSDSWFRNYNTSYGLYNQATGMHWYSTATDQFSIYAGSSSGSTIRFMTSGGTIRGYVHANDGNSIGFLNNAGGWALRTDSSNNTHITNDLYVSGANAEVQGNAIWHEGNLSFSLSGTTLTITT